MLPESMENLHTNAAVLSPKLVSTHFSLGLAIPLGFSTLPSVLAIEQRALPRCHSYDMAPQAEEAVTRPGAVVC